MDGREQITGRGATFRPRLLWSGVALGIAVLLGGVIRTWREPRFEGRPVSEWLDAYAASETRPGAWVDRTRGPRRLRDARSGRPLEDPELNAFVSLGPAAVPALMGHLHTGSLDSDRYARALARLPSPLADCFPSPWGRAARRLLAIEILLSLGPDARQALPALVRLLDTPPHSALGPMPLGIPVATRSAGRVVGPVLRTADRDRLVEAVCRICGDREGLEPLLLELGRSGRYRSLVALATAGGWRGAELAGLLVAALGDADPEVRGGALRLLETAADPSPPVVSRVAKALKDPDDTVRWLAARTLEASGSRDPEVVHALEEATQDTQIMVRTVARRTLGTLARVRPEAAAPANRGGEGPVGHEP